ncbi:MAG: formate dehydrogenase subunit delta [Cellulomonas sp.]
MSDAGPASRPAPAATAPADDSAALVRMANQIAANLAHHPRDAAVAAVAAHLRSFWAPEMRTALVAYVDGGGQGLTPLAAAAVTQVRAAGLSR